MTNLLETTLASRVRRNHALEHATLNILTSRYPGLQAAGVSDAGGFWVTGRLELDSLTSAVVEALARLTAGEARLAFHAGCGTGYATTGVIAGTLAWLGMLGAPKSMKGKLNRLPNVIVLAMLGAVAAQPLGVRLQTRVTTKADPGSLELTGIQVYERGGVQAFRVRTKG